MINIINNGSSNKIVGTNLSLPAGVIGPGALPVGTVIPIASHLAGSFSLSSGATNRGWLLANGQAIPAGHRLTGLTPDISNARFIRGNSSSGPVGGGASTTMTITQLPSHSHDASHSHDNTFSISTCNSDPWHSHSDSFSCSANTGSGSTEFHRVVYQVGSALSVNHNVGVALGNPYSYNTYGWQNQSHWHNMPWSANTDSRLVGHTHGIPTNSSTVCNTGTSTTASSGSGSSYGILPSYLSLTYIIRIS